MPCKRLPRVAGEFSQAGRPNQLPVDRANPSPVFGPMWLAGYLPALNYANQPTLLLSWLAAAVLRGGVPGSSRRKTQLAKIIKLPRATAHATQRAAVHHLKPIGNFVHTITFNNGKEFAAHQDIAHALKAKIFFARPYHAWERGLNENTNGLIRDFFPKGTDFSTIANAEVAKVERLLNARPRKSLGFRSPQEVFNSLVHS